MNRFMIYVMFKHAAGNTATQILRISAKNDKKYGNSQFIYCVWLNAATVNRGYDGKKPTNE